MKTIVISGINLFEGGPLSIYKDCLENIIKSGLNKTYNVIAFVHKKDLFIDYEEKITIVELSKSRKSYFFRLWYEYLYFYFYSKKRNIDIWISLHDITPNVKAEKRYVYCHNASPFMKTELKNLKYSLKTFLFSLFYKYLYKINIHKNTGVIVQQDWIRQEFKKIYKLENIIVARPNNIVAKTDVFAMNYAINKNVYQFIYPSFPRFFKNFEVICKASEILNKKKISGFKILLTIDGSENRYSEDLKKNFYNLKNIEFIGLQERTKLFDLYRTSDCMIFSSKLETWGLPISEFKEFKKPILLADLPYAYETVGSYDKAFFFDPDDASQLSMIMEKMIKKEGEYKNIKRRKIEQPFARNWEELFEIIFK